MQIVEAAEAGRLDVLWAIGYDIMQSHADIVRTQKVLETVPLVVVQDLFMNETARRFADVVLPATSWLEETGCKSTNSHLYLMPEILEVAIGRITVMKPRNSAPTKVTRFITACR